MHLGCRNTTLNMARKILIQAEPYKDSFKLTIPSEYNRFALKEMVRTGKTTLFELIPRIRSSKNQRGYLEGAVVPVYAYWQYGLDPRLPSKDIDIRDLFKADFWYDVIKKRDGSPRKTLKSWSKQQNQVLDKYTEWANENGAPVPNEQLYKLWEDVYSMDTRWSHYWDWLEFLGLDHDSMPSKETIEAKLSTVKKT